MAMLLLASGCAALAEATEPVVITTSVNELVVAVGKQVDYDLTMTPAVAKRAGYTFTVSDESVATVNKRGLVTGVKAGTCQLIITSDYDPTVSKTLTVTVVTPVKKITVSTDRDTLLVGQTATLTLAYQPEDATLQAATFESSHESVATVDASGVVTAVGRGQTTVTVRSKDGGAKAQVKLRVYQQAQSVELTASDTSLATGSRMSLKATVLPKNTDHKTLTWSSSDEAVATVDKSGRVKGLAPGSVVITAAGVESPEISGSIALSVKRMAKGVTFSQKQYGVVIGQSMTLTPVVSPADTSDQSVTFHSSKPTVVSVDENGVVTALAPGKAVITATTADGSRRQAKTTVEVIVPVTGVSFKNNDIRVGVNYHGTFTADIEPKEATNKNMTWTSSDESIARVSGATNRVRVSGRQWGRCQITGVTEDGGYSCTVYVDVGSLSRAVTVYAVEIRNDEPYFVLRNDSNMNITSVSFMVTATDEFDNAITLSTTHGATLYGGYDYSLAPGERSSYRGLSFYHRARFSNLQSLSVVVNGWTSDTGYYGHDGALYYDYTVPSSSLDWQVYETDLYKWTQSNQDLSN